MNRRFALSLLVFSLVTCKPFRSQGQQHLTLTSKQIEIAPAKKFSLNIPVGFQISVAAKTNTRLRFLAKSPDGRLFATDMHNRDDNRKGRVLIFDSWNEKTHQFSSTTEYLTRLRNPNQLAFYSSGGPSYIYVAETGFIKRYRYHPGDKKPVDSGAIIARYPDYGLNYKYGGWHLTRSMAFHNNKLYVSIGSSCNACIEKETARAVIMEMNPDGNEQKIYASGLRNAVGIKWLKDELWVTVMGRDQIGPDKPEDVMYAVVNGGYYGWPFYFQYKRKVILDKAFADAAHPVGFKLPPVAPVAFKAHSAPLGFDYFTGFVDTLFNNHLLVALHGSTSVWRQRGNAVVLVKDGQYQEVVTGFLQGKTEDKRFGRPCDVMQWTSSSFFVTDDKNGVLYYIWK